METADRNPGADPEHWFRIHPASRPKPPGLNDHELYRLGRKLEAERIAKGVGPPMLHIGSGNVFVLKDSD